MLLIPTLILAFIDPGESPDAMIRSQVAAYSESKPHAAVTVGIIYRGQQTREFWGRPARDSSALPNGQTIYEIGSATKVFTALLLTSEIVEGNLSLDDQLATRWPQLELSTDMQQITLGQLVSHSAGLPRLPTNIYPHLLTNPSDPYSKYHREELHSFLKIATIDREMVGKSQYSNLGVGLLGDLLALRSQLSYEELVRQRITEPLRMIDTRQVLDESQLRRFAPPQTAQGQPASNWNFDSLAGAGGLCSDIDDLLLFLQACLNPDLETTLGKAMNLSLTPLVKTGDGSGVACAWHYFTPKPDSAPVFWHNGGTGGYVSYLSFHRPSQTAVVLLSNSGDAMAGDMSSTQIGMRLQRALVEAEAKASQENDTSSQGGR